LSKDIIQSALTFLEPRAGTEIIEFIKKKPESKRNRYYRLLNPQPEFYALILHYEEALKQFSEFSDFDRIMHEDIVLSKHVDTLISNGMSGARIESSMYLFFILDKLIVSYFLSGKGSGLSNYFKVTETIQNITCSVVDDQFLRYLPMIGGMVNTFMIIE
jgi:hypothetical protein